MRAHPKDNPGKELNPEDVPGLLQCGWRPDEGLLFLPSASSSSSHLQEGGDSSGEGNFLLHSPHKFPSTSPPSAAGLNSHNRAGHATSAGSAGASGGLVVVVGAGGGGGGGTPRLEHLARNNPAGSHSTPMKAVASSLGTAGGAGGGGGQSTSSGGQYVVGSQHHPAGSPAGGGGGGGGGYSFFNDSLPPYMRPLHEQIMDVLEALGKHHSAWPFQKPVSRDEAPDYHEVISDPTDIQTMKKKCRKVRQDEPRAVFKANNWLVFSRYQQIGRHRPR